MNILKPIVILIFLTSCQTYRYLIKKQQIENVTVSLAIANKISSSSNNPIVHVQVDGMNFRYYYLFYKKILKKQDFKLSKKELKENGSPIFQVSFDEKSSIGFSHLDSLIIKKVIDVADSFELNELDYLANAKGFVLEKNFKKK